MRKMSHSEAGKLGYAKIKDRLILAKKDRLNKYNENPKLCKCCSGKIDYLKRRNDFCSHTCSAKLNNNKRNNANYSRYKALIKCIACSKETKNKKFCCHQCSANYQHVKNMQKIETSGYGHSKESVKKYIRHKNGNVCAICGISEWMNKQLVLILDHINGNPEDHNLINLRLICPNCDSQTDTYKGKNKGNGRYSRRMRFAEGKSF